MNKGQLIEAIRQLNPSATVQFLTQFDDRDLGQYLEQLRGAMSKHVHVQTFVGEEEKRVALRMVS
jgi:hypothetical protein